MQYTITSSGICPYSIIVYLDLNRKWYIPTEDRYMYNERGVDIDHHVPLKKRIYKRRMLMGSYWFCRFYIWK